MENKKRVDKSKQEDIALTRALSWFGAAMVLEILLLFVNRYYVNFTADAAAINLALALGTVVKVVAVLGLLGGAACAFFTWKRVKADGAFPFMMVVLTTTLLGIGVSFAMIWAFYRAAVEVLYVVVPAGAVLALVYYLYQKEFFFSAFGSGIGLLGLWLMRKNGGTHDLLITVYTVAGVVALVVILLLALKLKAAHGVLTVKDKQFAILPKQCCYLPVIVSCIAGMAALVAGLLLGSTAAFYLLFVLLAWLFVLLVYYTVKMM